MTPVQRGYLFAVASSLGLGLAIAAARAAYEGGATPLAISPVRAVLLAVMLGLVCVARRRSLRLPQRDMLSCLGLGVLAAHMFYGNIAAVETIPVGLAALCFFVYPPLVGALSAALDRRWPSAAVMGALTLAFAGVALALGVGFDDLDSSGVFLGVSAGTACAISVLWLARGMAHADPLPVMFWFSAVAAAILVPVGLLSGGARLPVTSMGWVACLAVVLCQVSSIPLYYAAVRLAGAETTAMLNNLQPLTSIFAAWALYDERLGLWQWGGAVMVLGGILWMQTVLRRPPRWCDRA
ncbi:MAG: DMT family transporter [Alphaproteobacteria bacterium]|nr:DMT family transporter [Alphaproteobacteria bacterium]